MPINYVLIDFENVQKEEEIEQQRLADFPKVGWVLAPAPSSRREQAVRIYVKVAIQEMRCRA